MGNRYKSIVLAALVLSSLLRLLAAQNQSDEFKAVLDRAAKYVALYEDRQLGNLIAAESYVQDAIWYASDLRTIYSRITSSRAPKFRVRHVQLLSPCD